MAEAANGTRLAAGQLLQAAVQQQLQQLQRAQGKNGQALGQQTQQKRAQNYQFTMTLQEILRKYQRYPPSLTFHIYETHFRFNNTQDSNIIPKESPMIKSFMKHLIKEEIPAEMMELLRDLSIKFYDGCLVVQVYDHRKKKGEESGAASEDAKLTDAKSEDASATSDAKDKEQKPPEPAVKPRKYRALLRPTPQSLYFDLLYHTDSALTRFTDHFALQMESELLTLTNRNLDLSVPLNPYLQHEHLKPEHEFPKKVYDKDKKEDKLLHLHRKETPQEIRKLHEEQMTMHKSSEYEELMLLLSSKYSSSLDMTSDKKLVIVGPTLSLSSDPVSLESTPLNTGLYGASDNKRTENTAAAPVIPSSNITSNQFMRLRFIEEIRKRKESQKAQAGAAVAALTQSAFPSSQARPGGIESNGTSAQPVNRRPQAPPQSQMGAREPAASMNLMNTQRMQTQQPPMPRAPLSGLQQSVQPQLAQSYNNMNLQGSMPRQGAPTQAQRSQAGSRGPMHQPHMPQQMSSANSPNYIGSPVGANARIQPGVQRPMNTMPNQGVMQQGQIPRGGQNPQLAKTNNSQRNMQERYLSQQNDFDQSAQAQAAKRQKMQNNAGGQIPQQNQYNMVGNRPQQMPNNGLIGNSMPNNSMQSGRMNNAGTLSSPLMSHGATVQQPMKNPNNSTQQLSGRPNTQPGAGRSGPQSATQLQQQQIFQMMLSPQEQQLFRQMQTRVSALVQMGNTGLTPNRTRLTPEQQQRAMQQGKALQQQMIQKFSAYFQKLRQLQVMQQQRQQQMQRQQIQMQQNQMSDNSMYSLQNNGMGMNLPALPDQVIGLPMMSQLNNGMPQGPGN